MIRHVKASLENYNNDSQLPMNWEFKELSGKYVASLKDTWHKCFNTPPRNVIVGKTILLNSEGRSSHILRTEV